MHRRDARRGLTCTEEWSKELEQENGFIKPDLNVIDQLSFYLYTHPYTIRYPADLVSQLHKANPGGVSAPLVLIEDSDSEEHHMHLCKRPLCHMGMQVSAIGNEIINHA